MAELLTVEGGEETGVPRKKIPDDELQDDQITELID